MLSPPETSPAILVVDDEAMLRSFAEMMLEELGYAALLAESGRAAVQKLLQDPDAVSAVLLDMSMPGLPPEETFRMLREIRPDLPVIILSGDLESAVRQRFGEGTIAGYIQKPYTDDDLQAALNKALSTPSTTAVPQGRVPLQLVGLSSDDLAQTRHEYLAQWRLEIPVLRLLLRNGDFPALQGMGHRLKGSGGCFGFGELTEIGKALEASSTMCNVESCDQQLKTLEDFLKTIEGGG